MYTNLDIKIISNDEDDRGDHFYCNVCEYPFISKDDFTVKDTYDCCYECYLTFVEARKKEWKEGWRPKQIVIDNYIEKRKELYEKRRLE
jgi:hypothetical protein